MKDGYRVEVLYGRTAQHGLSVAAVEVRALDVIEVRVHPVDVAEVLQQVIESPIALWKKKTYLRVANLKVNL